MTATTNQVSSYPGNYQFNTFNLITQVGQTIQLNRLFLELNIFEDIASPTISGNVIIADASGIYNNAPLTSEESISLNFNSLEDDITDKVQFRRDFDVYKISQKEKMKQDIDLYTLFFASPEYERNILTKVSKSYTATADQIVKLLLTESYPNGLGFTETNYRSLITEPSLYQENLVIPNWSPFETINFLTRRTLPNANINAANYVFFENADGFQFVSLESLLKQDPKWTYFWDVRQQNNKKKTTFAIEDFKVFNNQDVLANIQNGLYSGTLVTHDIVKKKYSKFTTNYLDNFDNTAHTQNNPLLSQQSDRNTKAMGYYKFYPLHNNLYDNMAEGNVRADKWLLQNSSLLQQMSAIRYIISVKGNTHVKVGQTITLNSLMRNPEDLSQMVPDKYYNGKYLVTAIRHHITPEEYNQTIELIGESYRENLATLSDSSRPARNTWIKDNGFLGNNNFYWFEGIVEDLADPMQLGRVRVRIYGHHTDDKVNIPTNSLPWAMVAMPPTSSGMSGIGDSPFGLLQGSTVWGFFRDGVHCQNPVVLGVYYGNPDEQPDYSKGFSDPDQIYPRFGKQTTKGTYPVTTDINTSATTTNETYSPHNWLKSTQIKKIQKAWPFVTYDEPVDPFNPTYAKNKVRETESGHIQEFDDTQGSERIFEMHRTGTYETLLPDGSKIVRILGDDFTIVLQDKNIAIQGNLNITVQGNTTLIVNGDVEQRISGDHNVAIDGDYSVTCKGDTNFFTDGDFNVKSLGQTIIEGTSKAELSAEGDVVVQSVATTWIKGAMTRAQSSATPPATILTDTIADRRTSVPGQLVPGADAVKAKANTGSTTDRVQFHV